MYEISLGLTPESQEFLRQMLSGGPLSVDLPNLRLPIMVTKTFVEIPDHVRFSTYYEGEVADARLQYNYLIGASSWTLTLHSPGLVDFRSFLEELTEEPSSEDFAPQLILIPNFPPLKTNIRSFLASVNNTLVTMDSVLGFTDLQIQRLDTDVRPF